MDRLLRIDQVPLPEPQRDGQGRSDEGMAPRLSDERPGGGKCGRI